MSSKAPRRATPTPAPVPLGLSLPQDFPPLAAPSAPPPAPPRVQRKVTSGAAIKPVVPVLPTPSARPTETSKERRPEELDTIPEPSSTAIGLSKREISSHTESSKDVVPKYKVDTVTDAPPKPSEVREKKSLAPTKPSDKKQRPSKLDIAATKEEPKTKVQDGPESTEAARATTKSKSEGSNALETSVPPTPATAVSQMSATSVVRQPQPRTIRVAPAPKAEASSPIVASSSKQASRRASLSSLHQPATPTSERNSDDVSFTTTSMSRANSPPPSKVGTAPMRQVTKSQQKKERQARAKQAEGSSKVEEPPTKVEEVQAPIIGRKKKTKKQRTQGTADSTPTATRPSSPVLREETADERPASGPATPAKDTKRGSSKATVEMKEPETPSSPATPAAAEQPKDKLTAASIVASLLNRGEISPSAADLFKIPAPGLNHRFESIEPDFPEMEIPSDDQLRALDQGEAIDIKKGPNHHVVVLPDRQQVPGLTAGQASRYLELRKQALANGDVPSHQALEGLIPAPPPINVSALTSISQRNSKTRRLANRFETQTAQSEPASMRAGATGIASEGVLNKKPSFSVVEAEQNLLMHRKEAEALEKKLGTLLKKNRRLVFGNAH